MLSGMGMTARSERARATRLRILEAGREVFGESGYTAATMKEIADRAAVAHQTLYFSFHSKPGLFLAVMAYASSGEVEPTPVRERGWYRDATSARSGNEALDLLVEGGAGIIERTSPLSQAFAEAAAVEPEVARRQQELASSRRRGIQRLAKHLGTLGCLRPLLTEAEVADVIYVLFSPETFRRFAACGWSLKEWRPWVRRSLGELILA